MSTCCFFGHRDTPEEVKPALHATIEKLIAERGVSTFYVGNQGAFDAYVRSALRQLQEKYPHIRYAVVLAYMPGKQNEYEDYQMLQYISTNYDLIVDTREQINPRYEARMESFQRMGITPVRHKLFAGDYSAVAHTPGGDVDYTRRVAHERKQNLEELITCFSSDRTRFEAELERAHKCGCRLYIVTEGGSYADLAAGNYRNDFDAKLALATYHTFEQRYNCHFVFVPPGAFPIFAHETLRRYIMDDLMAKFRAGKIKLS